MASIEPRKLKSNRTSYRVKWRKGGTRDGKWDGETFPDLTEAKRFKGLVDANGDWYPSEDQLRDYRFEYLLPNSVSAEADSSSALSVALEQPADVLLQPHAVQYVENLIKPNRETKRFYLQRLENHVFPILGQLPLPVITRGQMRAWQSGLVEKGLSGKTIANVRGEVLAPMFNASCLPGENGEPPLRTYNPLHGLDLPPHVKPERDIIELEREAQIFLSAAYEIDPEAGDLCATKLATGLRWGEITGLPVRSVHTEAGEIDIRQVIRREYGTYVLVPRPKTESGFRRVPTAGPITQLLERRSVGKGPRDFIFTAPGGNFWRYSQFYERRWVPIRKLAEQRGLNKHLTPHGLRHSLLTLLASEGVDLEALRNIAGHKRIQTTYDLYVHVTRKHHPAVRAAVTSFVQAPGRGGTPLELTVA
ncbi:tyrosine-type recombinase/integrase [Dactylosporangium sp. CA-233914]|uniref:tyrosine-type recombinase/integrase n=1 Tax=Dactylosporangium sp. CA-233914 TaxID=3239934 RepID=UPI003D90F543